jgi:hypothetical protein
MKALLNKSTSSENIVKKEDLASVLTAINCHKFENNTDFYTDSQFYNILYASVAMTLGLSSILVTLILSLINKKNKEDIIEKDMLGAESIVSTANDEAVDQKKKQEA